MSDTPMDDLVGKRVKGLSVGVDESVLAFHLDDDSILAYVAEGDCCSESWFADITGIGNLIDSKVRDVEKIELPDYCVDDGRGRQEEDEAYGFRIRSTGGVTDVVFRNSSNGYYGGWLKPHRGALTDMRPIAGNGWRSVGRDEC